MRLSILLPALALLLGSALGLSAQSVRVIFVSGQAQIQPPGEATPRDIVKGEIVTLGARIITGADGRVALTPMPGVKSLVAPNTDLVLESASETRQPDGTLATAATLDLKQGAVVTDLLKQEGVSYDYNVRTPRGLAGARGTNYTVAVNAAGIETIIVSHGSITFNLSDGRQLSIGTGQVSITDADNQTRTASSLDELSDADKAFAQEVAETTLAALEAAFEAGIEINPEAVTQALQIIEAFGVDVSASTLNGLANLLARIEAANRERSNENTEIVTQISQETSTYESFVARLDESQLYAFESILSSGGFNSEDETFRARFANAQFTKGMLDAINLYLGLPYDARPQLVSLGILGDGNEILFGSNTESMSRLLQSYALAYAPSPLLLDEAPFAAGETYVLSSYYNSFFFPGLSGDSGLPVFNLRFESEYDYGNLHVGAARVLNMKNDDAFDSAPNFQVAPEYDIFIRASELVSLAGTVAQPITFSSDARGILMESITINLANVRFPEGTVIVLTSRDGGTSFALGSGETIKIPNFGSSVVGRVNFLSGVYYGESLLNSGQTFADGSRGNILITSFADGLSPSFPTYTPVPVEPTAEELFAAGLSATQRGFFDALPSETRQKLVSLNDADITALLLDLDRENGVPFTTTDIDRVLDTYIALDTQSRAFVKTLAGGAGLPNLDGTPDIERWSAAAISQAAAIFNSLPPETRDALVFLGAGDAIIGHSAEFIQGLVAFTTENQESIAGAGWGNDLANLVNDSALAQVAATFTTPQQRETIRALRLDPYHLTGVLAQGDTTQFAATLAAIAAGLDASDLELLARLRFADTYSIFEYSGVVEDMQTVVENYNLLTPERQEAARALGLGAALLDPTRAETIADFYLDLPLAEREALRDTRLVEAFFRGIDASDSTIAEDISSALAAYLGLSKPLQNYLLSAGDDFDLFAVLNSQTSSTDDNGRPVRSLSAIASLFASIAADPADLATLKDMDLGRALLHEGYLGLGESQALEALQAAITVYRDLPLAAKNTLRELGIIGNGHVGFLGDDYEGVTRLLNAYAALPAFTRVDTQWIDESAATNRLYNNSTSYFLPYDRDISIQNVTFVSGADLHVGAVRRLRIDNSLISEPDETFVVTGDRAHNVILRAGDLIDLNNTPLSSNLRGILMEATTIKLANFHFPEGSTAALTSKYGTLNFGPNAEVGSVNFISNVTYGGAPLDNLTNFTENSRGNIAIGSFAAPAVLPNYTGQPSL